MNSNDDHDTEKSSLGTDRNLVPRGKTTEGSQFYLESLPMRLFAVAFLVSAFITATSAFAQEREPLSGGSPVDRTTIPGWARFEPNPAQEYLVARAREESAFRNSQLRYYQSIGYDFAHPPINVSSLSYTSAPSRPVRRYVAPAYRYPTYIVAPWGSDVWNGY